MKQAAGQSGGHDHASGSDLMALSVKPGETKEWVIRSGQAQTLHVGCLIPGHFEAGMKGRVVVQENATSPSESPAGKPANRHDHNSHKH